MAYEEGAAGENSGAFSTKMRVGESFKLGLYRIKKMI